MDRMQEQFDSVRDERKLVVKSELGLTTFSTMRDLQHFTRPRPLGQRYK